MERNDVHGDGELNVRQNSSFLRKRKEEGN
jgi:hypothetical protein